MLHWKEEWLKKSGIQFRLCVTLALDRVEYSVGLFPYANWLTLVADRSRLSSNFFWCRRTAITSPLLDKRTDVYNWLHVGEIFLRYSEGFSFVKTLFVAYGTQIFQYAFHNSISLVAMSSQKNAVHNNNTEKVVWKMHMWSGETRNNREFVFSFSPYRACALLRFMLEIFVNISGVPSDTAKHNLDGRIVGGNPAQIEQHPHQVKLLNCYWIELFFHALKYKY